MCTDEKDDEAGFLIFQSHYHSEIRHLNRQHLSGKYITVGKYYTVKCKDIDINCVHIKSSVGSVIIYCVDYYDVLYV